MASPSVDEARQVFAVRRMLEAEMTRAFVRAATSQNIQALREHVHAERWPSRAEDVPGRTALLFDFHVRMANSWATRCWRRCWVTCCRAAR